MNLTNVSRLGLLALLGAVGCGGGGASLPADGSSAGDVADGGDAGAPDRGPTAQQACSDVAQAQCMKRMTCSNGDSITRVYGSMDACVARATLSCMDGLAAPQTGNSPTLVEECVTAFSGLSCGDFFDNVLPAVCAPLGPRPAGGPCTFSGQCASGFCAGTKNAACGTCAAPPVVGASCATSGCDHGQSCVAATTTCQIFQAAGSPCGAGDPCGNGLGCVGAVASTSTLGTCEAAGAQAGVACGGTMPACDGTIGLFCGGAAGAKTCLAITYVGAGMPCGDLSATSHVECITGACYTSTGAAGAGEVGTCQGAALDGAACDTVLGPECLSPARCVITGAGTTGTCTVPIGVSCG